MKINYLVSSGIQSERKKPFGTVEILFSTFLWFEELWAALDDLVNPDEVVSDLGVNTRVGRIATADAPRDNAFKFTVADKWAS